LPIGVLEASDRDFGIGSVLVEVSAYMAMSSG